MLVIFLLQAMILQAQSIKITNNQARWCLENNDRVIVLTERILVKDSIITIKNNDEKSYIYKIDMLKEMLENTNTVIFNQDKAVTIVTDKNVELEKATKKNKWMFNTLKVIGASEFAIIILMAILFL